MTVLNKPYRSNDYYQLQFQDIRCTFKLSYAMIYLYYIPGVTNKLQVRHDNIQALQVVYQPTERT